METKFKALALNQSGKRATNRTGRACRAATLGFLLASSAAVHAQEWPNIALSSPITGFSTISHIANAGDGSGRLFVVELIGRIRIVKNGVLQPTPFLDISDRVGSRQGLLSVAFPPNFATSRRFYVNYTHKTTGEVIISRFTVSADPDIAAGLETHILVVEKSPYYIEERIYHAGGELSFGPDENLYVGIGDGDFGQMPGDSFNFSQRLDTWRGKILRLNVEVGNPSTYSIPPGNPYVGVAGALPEIWAVGVRNPWRSSFDRQTGDFYIADVGQEKYEEINFQPAGTGGQNYGWKVMEGDAYNVTPPPPNVTFTLPVAKYIVTRAPECSVIGGRVYRGSAYPRMNGVYFYGDYCSGKIWGLRQVNNAWQNSLLRDPAVAGAPLALPESIVSFGESETGDLYVSDNRNGAIFLITDSVANLAPVANNQSITMNEDGQANVTLTATDADNNPLTFSIVTGPAHGTLNGTAPNLVYTPAANYNGADSFAFKAHDGIADSNLATVSITVTSTNDAPVAQSQSITVGEDSQANVTLSASDTENSPLTFSIVTSPAHGTLTGTAQNRVYIPAANYHGPDSFVFRAHDGSADSNLATVSITVASVNDVPLAQNDAATTKKNKAVTISVLANDTDADNDALSIAPLAPGTQGTANITANGRSIQYTPARNFTGIVSFNYTVSDGKGGTATATVTVTVTAK